MKSWGRRGSATRFIVRIADARGQGRERVDEDFRRAIRSQVMADQKKDRPTRSLPESDAFQNDPFPWASRERIVYRDVGAGPIPVPGPSEHDVLLYRQALEARRPVEAMLRDPLGEIARKERRSLLGISAIATAVGLTGAVPEKIENLGITFAAPVRQHLLWVFLAVVLYYTAAFIVYAFNDFLSYLYAVHQGRKELRKQRQSGPVPLISSGPGDVPWSFVAYVTPAAIVRGIFDFFIPLAVAGFAMWSLWGAVHQVATAATSAPTAPAVAPSIPQSTTPNLKAAPPVRK